MQTVPNEIVEAVWQELGQMTQEQASDLAQRIQSEQPTILMYLLAAEEADEDGEVEPGWLLEIGAVICEAMRRVSDGELPEVTGEELDAAEQANIRYLEDLEEGSEMDYEQALRELTDGYNQMPLLGSILEQVMGGTEPGDLEPVADVGMGLLRVKTVIDCLDR